MCEQNSGKWSGKEGKIYRLHSTRAQRRRPPATSAGGFGPLNVDVPYEKYCVESAQDRSPSRIYFSSASNSQHGPLGDAVSLPSRMPSYLVTGANRGLGFAMVEELDLVAKYGKDRLALITLDYADGESIEKAAEAASALLPNGLDYLLSYAGVNLQETALFDQIDMKVLEDEFRINAFAPFHLTRSFLPLVRKSNEKKVVFVTSDLASLENAPSLSTLSIVYSMTKASLNMLARKWAPTLHNEGIAVVLVHPAPPGWVGTDMGKLIREWVKENIPHHKMITIEESTTGTLSVIKQAKPEKAIKYYTQDGSTLPW
ncbi:predicted protein [Postia placenta Mad-698-R]|uniref:Ketoreductase (KR) domain-containing protein n=2 Tax=Rhodonia placenta TaxID=104341 RepID=A0A1X6NC93_9APHY|nr:hypothetical protein POSPLADRAFT_1043597 [Postia placenta MAD-698-R-SB12]EED85465.1 predicted protein [Postia placenta Mad-698-R]KAF9813652.1 hypothetical protein IEO21_05484 [Postia placenta]OSX66102.1 hypothetical protein POSPLADRAFT_1043597 [Postia placenta MAD-698-R-SB12]